MHRFSDLFLTSSGRIGRIGFLGGASVLLALWAGFELLAPLVVRDWIGWAVAALVLYCGACVLSQRLHDRGRSGWWSGPILLAVAMAWPRPQAPLDWVAAAALMVVIVDLGLLPGQKTFNRYGAPLKVQSGGSPV